MLRRGRSRRGRALRLSRSGRLLHARARRLHRLHRLQALRLQVLQGLVGQVQLVLLHDALLHYTLLHLDVLVHGQLVDGVQGRGGRGVRGGESLPLHLRTLKRFVQPLHREGALAEVIHGCVGACWPSRATPASTDQLSDRRNERALRDDIDI